MSISEIKGKVTFLLTLQDINELELPKTCKTVFPDPDDLLSFKLIIYPDEGFYRNGEFNFSFKIGAAYPHEPPKVRSLKTPSVYVCCPVFR